jgi:NADH-quinone oxidoreductase subunit E
MLSEAEQRELDAEAPRYPHRRGLAIEALRIVQRHRGWLSDGALRDVAAHLGVATGELEGLATFYSLLFRHPVGRHVVLLCDCVSCWLTGYEDVLDAFANRHGLRPGETSPDGRFTLLPVSCLGACHRAPVLLVDDDLHGEVDPQRVGEILESYR